MLGDNTKIHADEIGYKDANGEIYTLQEVLDRRTIKVGWVPYNSGSDKWNSSPDIGFYYSDDSATAMGYPANWGFLISMRIGNSAGQIYFTNSSFWIRRGADVYTHSWLKIN